MRRVGLGDTVRLPTGDEGHVTGTMTLQLPIPKAELQRSVCVMPAGGPPVWIAIEDVVLVEKAKR